jgi:hypothetical protein
MPTHLHRPEIVRSRIGDPIEHELGCGKFHGPEVHIQGSIFREPLDLARFMNPEDQRPLSIQRNPHVFVVDDLVSPTIVGKNPTLLEAPLPDPHIFLRQEVQIREEGKTQRGHLPHCPEEVESSSEVFGIKGAVPNDQRHHSRTSTMMLKNEIPLDSMNPVLRTHRKQVLIVQRSEVLI